MKTLITSFLLFGLGGMSVVLASPSWHFEAKEAGWLPPEEVLSWKEIYQAQLAQHDALEIELAGLEGDLAAFTEALLACRAFQEGKGQ